MPSVESNPSNTHVLKSLSKKLKAVTKNTADFLSIQQHKSDKIQSLLRETYDLTTSKDTLNKNTLDILPQLVTDQLDPEQIWQIIELRNNFVWPQFLKKSSKLLALKKEKIQIKYHEETNNSSNEIEDGYGSENSMSDEDEDEDEEMGEQYNDSNEDKHKTKKKSAKKGKPSIVDDKFFKLSEMEAFLKAEDEKELGKQRSNGNDDFSINYFDENLESEEENVEYKDFFGEEEQEDDEQDDEEEDDEGEEDDQTNTKSQKKSQNSQQNGDFEGNENRNIEPDDNDSNESDPSDSENREQDSEFDKKQTKSSFEDRQDRLKQRINDYENEILGEKPWQLKGEINATNRPHNSLLEEILEFEPTTRPAIVITQETTLRLEDIIRQRIKDQVWDDVELKIKPISTTQEYRKKLVLDQEKSKESLAHIYEKEYQKELEKLDPNAADAKEEEPKSHKEIKEMMSALFVKLDALSNFHFTPKPVAPEPKIITNTPAINLEEVAPVGVSNAKLLAPEEIRKRAKGDILGSNERSKTDKNRERRHKKQKQRAIQKVLEEKQIQKQKQGIKLSNKEEMASMTKKLTKRRDVEQISSKGAGGMKSSKAFFTKLNETTSMQKNSLKKKPEASSLSAKKLKL